MAGIRDVPESTVPNVGSAVPYPEVLVVVYGTMHNSIPQLQDEPFANFEQAMEFAVPLANNYEILYIEYQGVKLGVNL